MVVLLWLKDSLIKIYSVVVFEGQKMLAGFLFIYFKAKRSIHFSVEYDLSVKFSEDL